MSRLGMLAAILPGMIMVISFYTLAVHMHSALGGWPDQIGYQGFPEHLIKHSELQSDYCGIMVVSIFVLWPLLLLIFGIVPRFRRFIGYLSLYGISFVVALALTFLGPSKYLYWWWD